MGKTIFLKRALQTILVLWFFVCILPGDCLLLGCAEKHAFHCTENESVTVTHNATDPSLPQDNSHCSDCCVLCIHNLVMHMNQNSPYTLAGSFYRFKVPLFKQSNTIFQSIIYHPPRLTV
ncbi:MAG: hypothetical protein L3J17_14000 [Candidatus Jettenia sp.]|nr:MAG: hypothetical protein L3J17_14000 [Candidatus Jettenia sp.]